MACSGTADGLLGAIGNTPLIELHSLSKLTGCRILGKAEHLNPGGSVKDRAAKWMILDFEKQGLLTPGQRGKQCIIEATGGNTGVALALVAAARGYQAIFTMPENVSSEKVDAMKTFGAKVILQPCVPFTNDQHYYHVAERLAKENQGVWTNQFENLANSLSHYESTGPEIWTQTKGEIDGFVCACGTGGTLAGCSQYLKERDSNIKTYLIDPPGSGLYSFVTTGEITDDKQSTVIEGIGIMRITANFSSALIDGGFKGTDREAVEMAYFLLRNDGIFVGPSAAMNCVGAVKLARKLNKPGATIVTILCDGGDKYRSKLFSKEWLRERQLEPEHVEENLDFVE